MSFELKGKEAMAREIARIARRFPVSLETAMRFEGELVMTRSKRDFVPVDFGTLKGSGHVESRRRGKDIEVVLSYGGAAAAYALAVHEHPSGASPPSWKGVEVVFQPQGRGPKYL